MKTSSSKVRPGLSLSSHQIRSRLRNRTIQKQNPDNSSYIQDEELILINKMSKVEREMSARENLKEIEAIQKRLNETNDRKKQKQIEQEIENRIRKQMEQNRNENEMAKEK